MRTPLAWRRRGPRAQPRRMGPRSRRARRRARVHVLAGAERHETIDMALRYLGLGAPELIETDDQGRLLPDALAASLARIDRESPTIVCLQAGNVHSGAFDPIAPATELAHSHGAWVHVDGAFGLWAAASPTLRHLVSGLGEVDSCSTDAHKTLNVPYDSGVAIVRDPAPLRTIMGVHGSYLVTEASGPGDPMAKVPEYSRRARGVPVWAALRSLGRTGVASLVEGMVAHAAGDRGRCGADERRLRGQRRRLHPGVHRFRRRRHDPRRHTEADRGRPGVDVRVEVAGRDVLRVSVSNWSTNADDVAQSVEAVRAALKAARS